MVNQKSKKIYLNSLTIREKNQLFNRTIASKDNKNYEKIIGIWKQKVGETNPKFLLKRLEWSDIDTNGGSKTKCITLR